ncbi:MAG: hypothetical protein ACI9Y7_000999 [Dokdonia sp.]|jgi:hypothetical protein
MMCKLIVLFSIFLISFSGYSQSDSLYFSVSSYHMNGELYRKDTIAIKNTKQHLDVYFYKEHFHMFYGLPKKLIRKEYKNQEITEWSNPNDDKANWSDSYTYDSQGRLIKYEYSACVICSQLPWGYTLAYDENNNIIEQRTHYPSLSNTQEENEISLKLTKKVKDYTKLTYNSNGNITVLEKYGAYGIKEKIERIK